MTIAGRVLASSGLDVVLADAFAHVEVALDASSDLEEGDLAIVAGTPLEGRLSAARVVRSVETERDAMKREIEAALTAWSKKTA